MTHVEFPVALVISALLHAAFVAIWSNLPEAEYGSELPVYQVSIVQAPPKPRAQRPQRSRESPAALDIEVPAPREALGDELAFPELAVAESEGPSERPITPRPAVSPAQPIAPETGTTPQLPESTRPTPELPAAAPSPGGAAVVPAPPASSIAVSPPPAPNTASVRRSLPQPLPPREAPSSTLFEEPSATAPLPSVAESRGAIPPPPPATTADPLEQAARRARRVEQSRTPEIPVHRAQPEPERNPLTALAIRRYRNGMQGKVKDNHTYPAGFACGIETLMQITLKRDGTLLASELLSSSGDELYDYAVDLSIRRTKFDPVPSEIQGESYQETLRFTPKRCPSDSP